MQKSLFTIVFILLTAAVLYSAGPVQAAKKRVWTTTTKTTSTATKPTYSVKLRSDRKALTVYFYSVNTAKSIEYELTYLGNGIEQGAYGTVTTGVSNTNDRLLLFGTCSHNVCTYHNNIQNMVLKITSKVNSGTTYIKRYRIKV